jgi:uncharacterized protein (DUF983 family)
MCYVNDGCWLRPDVMRKTDFPTAPRLKMKHALANQTPSPYLAGLTCRCPRCGKGKLFVGYLTVRPYCDVCDIDFAFADTGDGAAVFVILFAGLIVTGAALGVEIEYQPPYWVHALLWGPLILIATLVPLRLIKSLLIALQYHYVVHAE